MSNSRQKYLIDLKRKLHSLTLDGKIYNRNRVYKTYFDSKGNLTSRNTSVPYIKPFHYEELNTLWQRSIIDTILEIQTIRSWIRKEETKYTEAAKKINKHIKCKRVLNHLRPLWKAPASAKVKIGVSNDINKVGAYHTYISHDAKKLSHVIIPNENLAATAQYLEDMQSCKTKVIAAALQESTDDEDYKVYKVVTAKTPKEYASSLNHFSTEKMYAAIYEGFYPEQNSDNAYVPNLVVYVKNRANLDQRLSTKANHEFRKYYTNHIDQHKYHEFCKQLDRQIHYSELEIAIQKIIDPLNSSSYEFNIAVNALKDAVNE